MCDAQPVVVGGCAEQRMGGRQAEGKKPVRCVVVFINILRSSISMYVSSRVYMYVNRNKGGRENRDFSDDKKKKTRRTLRPGRPSSNNLHIPSRSYKKTRLFSLSPPGSLYRAILLFFVCNKYTRGGRARPGGRLHNIICPSFYFF